MMKKKILLFALVAVFCGGILLTSRALPTEVMLRKNEKRGHVTFLVAGLDQVAGNTDVLFLASVDYDSHVLSVLQIPRDTYFSAGTAQNKINQIYPLAYAKTKKRSNGIRRLKEEIESAFSLSIDHYMAVDIEAFETLIDSLGGVNVVVPCDMNYTDEEQNLTIRISRGENHLKGKEAVHFMRFRSDYLMGDLGRVDAQKLLFSALFKRIREANMYSILVKSLPALYSHVETSMPLSDALSVAYSFYKEKDAFSLRLMTLPGESTRFKENGGTWYYAVNRKASQELLSSYFFANGSFDPQKKMLNSNNVKFENIYFDHHFSYTVYTEENIDSLKIKVKNK
jgi:LCP family protein required for cell wall assembly